LAFTGVKADNNLSFPTKINKPIAFITFLLWELERYLFYKVSLFKLNSEIISN
jgi:hypothetical protein